MKLTNEIQIQCHANKFHWPISFEVLYRNVPMFPTNVHDVIHTYHTSHTSYLLHTHEFIFLKIIKKKISKVIFYNTNLFLAGGNYDKKNFFFHIEIRFESSFF